MDWELIVDFLAPFGQAAWGYFSSPVLLIQFGVIGTLFLPALVLSWRVEPGWSSGPRGSKACRASSGL